MTVFSLDGWEWDLAGEKDNEIPESHPTKFDLMSHNEKQR